MFRHLLLLTFSALMASPAPAAITASPMQREAAPLVLVHAPGTTPRLTRVGEITRLRNLIWDLRSGSLHMNQFEPLLQIAVRARKAKTGAMLADLGRVVDVSFVGAQDGGGCPLKSLSKHGVARWICIAANGNIAGLRAMSSDAPDN